MTAGDDDGAGPVAPGAGGAEQVPAAEESPEEPVSSLRGAGVDVNARRVGQVVMVLCLVTLLVLSVLFVVGGVRRNHQIADLRAHGVDAEMTVTGCIGLLGGSGSNTASYQCRGTLTLDGVRYEEGIPGTIFRYPGSTVAVVVVPGDPALLAPADQFADEHTSAKVFVLPAVLFGVVVVVVVLMVVVRRRRRRRATTEPPAPSDRSAGA